MSLLQKFSLLPLEQRQRLFQSYRNVGFPPEVDLFLVREKCADWIETNFWNNRHLKPDKPEHEEMIKQWVESFCIHLQSCIPIHGVGNEPPRLKIALTYFKSNLHPVVVFTALKNCLNEELMFHAQVRRDTIASLEQNILTAKNLSSERIQVWNDVFSEENQMAQLMDWGTTSQEMGQNYTRSIIQKRSEYVGLERTINEILGKSLKEAECLLLNLTAEHEKLVLNHEELFQQLGMTYDDFLGECVVLKENLHQIDQLITDVIQSSHQPTADFVGHRHTVKRHLDMIIPLFNQLIDHSLILVKHPDSIIKQEKKFDVDICCLAPKTFNLQLLQSPNIKVIAINDIEAAKLYANRSPNLDTPRPSSTVVTFERYSYNFDPQLSRLTIKLHDMKVPNRPSDPRNKPTSVLRQRFYLYFYCEVTVKDRPYTLWTLTYPFVYATNVSQILEASCTIFWDSYLKGNDPFQIPDEVSVSRMTQALANHIQRETNSPWILTERQRSYLAQKILQTEMYTADTIVSRNQFESVKDPTTGVPFWEWLSGTLKLIKDHLQPYWNNGYISGFMARLEAEDLLHIHCIPGIFILRCSDTTGTGGLSITWYEEGVGPCSVQPLGDRCFQIKKLAERLGDIPNFIDVMYPTESTWKIKSKKEAFPFIPTIADNPYQHQRTSEFIHFTTQGGKKSSRPYISTGLTWALLHFGVDQHRQSSIFPQTATHL